MGIEQKKRRQYPKRNEKMGIGAEKMMLVPKEKRENGYRREKMTLVPKRNSSLPQKALRVDIFSKERYNSWKKAPMEGKYHSRRATGGSYGFI